MLEQAKKDLCKYRIEKARECLNSAELLKNTDGYMFAANRAYYAIFHAVRSIMALDGEDRKKHSGVISYFQEHYIKNGVFDKKYSYIIKNAFMTRQESDYEDFYIISKEEANEQIENAKVFVSAVNEYLKSVIE